MSDRVQCQVRFRVLHICVVVRVVCECSPVIQRAARCVTGLTTPLACHWMAGYYLRQCGDCLLVVFKNGFLQMVSVVIEFSGL